MLGLADGVLGATLGLAGLALSVPELAGEELGGVEAELLDRLSVL
ncbi:MAG: hypothetical protein WCO31_02570 [Actinomycetes bacterium]